MGCVQDPLFLEAELIWQGGGDSEDQEVSGTAFGWRCERFQRGLGSGTGARSGCRLFSWPPAPGFLSLGTVNFVDG